MRPHVLRFSLQSDRGLRLGVVVGFFLVQHSLCEDRTLNIGSGTMKHATVSR
jgi:hypothetical protein